MANERKSGLKASLRKYTGKALKATIKGVLFYAVYFVLWMFVAPFATMIPGLQQSIETFVAIYITLMAIGELMAGTIYQYFFGAGKAMFVILYLMLSLKGGIMGMTIENINLLIDLRLFLAIAMLLSLLGLAKSVLQAINYVNDKAELTLM
jgi:Ca2+/Na+ antiporter